MRSSDECVNSHAGGKTASQSCENESDAKDTIFSNNKETLNISAISNLNDSIQEMQNNLDESCKTFEAIAKTFENINFDCLKDRIEEMNLNESSSDSIKLTVNDLRQSFDEKYVENRLADLTKETSSKFCNHPGEFGDIPEISEFFRTCSRLEHGLVKLRQQRDDCKYLQKRMQRAAEASFDRVALIQENIMRENGIQQNDDYTSVNQNKEFEGLNSIPQNLK